MSATTHKNNQTAPTEDYLNGYQEASEEALSAFNEALNKLPKETANDLRDLFQQYAEEDEDSIRAEIVKTIQEVLIPQSVRIKVEEGFSLESEDPYVRNKLDNYRKKVGAEIKKRRQKLKMSQEELAEHVGISQSHICRLETGRHVPTYITIEKVAKALGTTPSQIDPGFND